MNFATKMLAIAVTSLPLLAAAQLGQSEKLVANVPFQFRVGQKLIPAGQVVVQRGNTFGSALLVSNWEAKASQYVLPRAQDKDKKRTNTLVFHKYGDRYFLVGISIQGSQNEYTLPETKAEAEVRAQNITAPQEVMLALLK
jgi:hypothetical protein